MSWLPKFGGRKIPLPPNSFKPKKMNTKQKVIQEIIEELEDQYMSNRELYEHYLDLATKYEQRINVLKTRL